MIEGIEEFRPELQFCRLSRPAHGEPLDDGKIKILLARTFQDADAGIAEADADGIVRAEHRRVGETAGVDVGVSAPDVGFYGTVVDELPFGTSSRERRPIGQGAAEYAGFAREVVVGQGERMAGLNCDDSGYHPSAQKLAPEGT